MQDQLVGFVAKPPPKQTVVQPQKTKVVSQRSVVQPPKQPKVDVKISQPMKWHDQPKNNTQQRHEPPPKQSNNQLPKPEPKPQHTQRQRPEPKRQHTQRQRPQPQVNNRTNKPSAAIGAHVNTVNNASSNVASAVHAPSGGGRGGSGGGNLGGPGKRFGANVAQTAVEHQGFFARNKKGIVLGVAAAGVAAYAAPRIFGRRKREENR